MPTDVIVPALGVAQEKGTLIKWLKAEGQSVTKGEPLMEVETDKAVVEIEAPASGILTDVTASPGDEIPVGNRIALIVAPGEKPGMSSSGRSQPRTDPATPAKSALSQPDRLPQTKPAPSGVAKASPAARKIAREKGIELSAVRGSGPEGAVVAEDILRAAADKTPTPAGPPRIRETAPLTPMRRIVGERMTRSKQTAPHFYLTVDVDMTLVTRQKDTLKENTESPVPTINDFILCATARVLRDFPSLNAAFSDQGIRLYSDINLGVAVALEDGLVVPVIRNADRLSLQEITRQSRELAEKAQKKRLLPSEYEGGTFTVSNLGMLGIDRFIAIINPPQCAILAAGQVAPRVVPYGEGIAVRPIMTLSLSADHRVVDGAIAARFLREVERVLESRLT